MTKTLQAAFLRALALLFVTGLALAPWTAAAQTPGYPEQVVQWTVKSGESCDDIAAALYGSSRHAPLVMRYNRVACTPGAPIRAGLTLVLPAKVTTVPTARITSVNPQANARPAGGGWSPAQAGQPLGTNSSVNTLKAGRAGIRFIDRTRIYLAEHTLVVIYGTASQTQVSKSVPKVELKSGELQAGLAALRGDSVAVAVEGGGIVEASSKDTVLSRRGKRTNVAVFQGKARVNNAGKSVDVPKNFGTRFVDKKPPEKPRPLPPAPLWQRSSGTLVLGFNGTGTLEASWQSVPKAKLYRVEVARDAAFEKLVVREQVPATVTSFRGQSLPAGSYHVRVRAIDNDDFLGIASQVRSTEIVGASWKRGTGKLDGDSIRPGRYAQLALEPSERLELSFDGGTFGPLPELIDFGRLEPKSLAVRRRGGGGEQKLAVLFVEPKLSVTSKRDGNKIFIEVRMTNLDRINVSEVVTPRARVRAGAETLDVALSPSGAGLYLGEATVSDPQATIIVEVLDGRSRVIGSSSVAAEQEPPPPTAAPEPELLAGPNFPIVGLSPRTNVMAWAPTARNSGSLAVRVDGVGQPTTAEGQAYASGHFGPLSIDASVGTPSSRDSVASDSSAWLGVRLRGYRLGRTELEVGPAFRVSVPLDDEAPSSRFEPAFGLAGVAGRWTWLVNVGGRLRLQQADEQRAPVDFGQGFLIFGGTVDMLSWLRGQAFIDAHLLAPDADVPMLGRGGLSLGLEAGETFFVGLGGRVTPWDDVGGGHLAGQLSVGLRELQ